MSIMWSINTYSCFKENTPHSLDCIHPNGNTSPSHSCISLVWSHHFNPPAGRLSFHTSQSPSSRSAIAVWSAAHLQFLDNWSHVLLIGVRRLKFHDAIYCDNSRSLHANSWLANSWLANLVTHLTNVRGESVFSVMAAGWFCEKSGWIGKVEDVKPNRCFLKQNGFQPATILRRIFTRMNCETCKFHPVWFIKTGYHLVLGFMLYVRCRLVEA
jgi:hypothetical protein